MNHTVLICIPCLLVGGTELQTLHLAEALLRSGHRVVVCCYFEYNFDMVQRFRAVGCQVVCLSAYGVRPEGRQMRQFLYAGLKRVVNEQHPTVAHVQYMAPGAWPILILRHLGVKKIVATIHTSADIYRNLHLIHFLQRCKVDVFTCVSQVAEQSFFGTSTLFDKSMSIHKHMHCTIPNCLPQKWKVAPRLAATPCYTIGVISRMESLKGVDLVMPAFAQLLQRGYNCRLVLVGDGTLRPTTQQQQKELSVPTDRVKWVGTVAPEQTSAYYATMDIVWIPSRTEGFGLTAIEAMSQGCAVVATAVGGLTEVVTHDTDGILLQSNDATLLAANTAELIDNPEKLCCLQHAAQQHAAKYAFENYKERIARLYSQL